MSESGNHYNNIYNQNWSEQYHGLGVVPKTDSTARIRAISHDGSTAQPDDMVDSTFQIRVPTTVELAQNLRGNLLLETGDMDNNVHPANTIRLVNALIKANKRFDFMLLPGKPHGYGDMVPYTNRLMFEYFAEPVGRPRKDAAIK
jgi:hypothetical protein